jgi:hypothetical protein
LDKVSFEGTVSKVLREPFECLMFEFEKVRTERSAGRQQAGRRRAKGGEPDSAAGVYPGERSPLILLEKLGTDCDDRERKYSLPRILLDSRILEHNSVDRRAKKADSTGIIVGEWVIRPVI